MIPRSDRFETVTPPGIVGAVQRIARADRQITVDEVAEIVSVSSRLST